MTVRDRTKTEQEAADIINSVAFDSARCEHTQDGPRRVTLCREELEAVLAGLLLKLGRSDDSEEAMA